MFLFQTDENSGCYGNLCFAQTENAKNDNCQFQPIDFFQSDKNSGSYRQVMLPRYNPSPFSLICPLLLDNLSNISSHELKAPGVRPSSVRPSVRRRRPPFPKIFSSETHWSIEAKFYLKHLWEGGTNVYVNNPGHMTNVVAMSIYSKNRSKIFFSGTGWPVSTKPSMTHQ